MDGGRRRQRRRRPGWRSFSAGGASRCAAAPTRALFHPSLDRGRAAHRARRAHRCKPLATSALDPAAPCTRRLLAASTRLLRPAPYPWTAPTPGFASCTRADGPRSTASLARRPPSRPSLPPGSPPPPRRRTLAITGFAPAPSSPAPAAAPDGAAAMPSAHWRGRLPHSGGPAWPEKNQGGERPRAPESAHHRNPLPLSPVGSAPTPATSPSTASCGRPPAGTRASSASTRGRACR